MRSLRDKLTRGSQSGDSLFARLKRLFAWARPGTLAAAAIGFPLFFVLSSSILTLSRVRVVQERTEQPIEFNHRLHVQDVDLECDTCHEFYESETFSGLPTTESCAFCHDEAQGENTEEVKLVNLLAEHKPLEWRRLFRQPPHVFYSHRRHFVVAGIECEVCHGDIGATERPPRRVKTLDMDGCIDCHERSQIANDCTSCHR